MDEGVLDEALYVVSFREIFRPGNALEDSGF